MHILYNLGIRIYYFLVLLASLWNEKAKRWIHGRREWEQHLKGRFGKSDKVIWFHCASLGEFEQGRPLIESVRKRYPDYKILLTFFSPSGYEKRKSYEEADMVSYLPLDTAQNARKFLALVPVEKVFFIKYEFWLHFLRAIREQNISVYLVSGNFRSGQLFFKWYGAWYKKFLHYFTHIFVQNRESMELLNGAGIEHATVTGDTRFDRVIKIAKETVSKDYLLTFSNKKPVIIAGSTWEKDEEILHKVYEQIGSRCNWIIAPHEPSRKNIDRLSGQFAENVLYSEISEVNEIHERVILVDTIGHLSSLYQYGTIAYIGGGFGRGIHNILEAAVFGLPLVFGPNFHDFQEARELISYGVAYVIKHPKLLYSTIDGLVNSEKQRKIIAETAESYIIKSVGATDKIVDFVFIKRD